MVDTALRISRPLESRIHSSRLRLLLIQSISVMIARNGFSLFVIFLIAIASVARIYGAWCYRYNFDPDSGVVYLMAKHMVEGKTFPIFFYGQSYMGSLEPATSALLGLLFGISGFVFNLGTVIWGVAFLPLVYCWGREAGASRLSGLAALTLCILGPSNFFVFQCIPRGGYALTIFIGVALVFLSAKMCFQESKNTPPSMLAYFFLGTLAGIGWWTNQLITAALLTSAVLFALTMRRRIICTRTLLGVVGFATGSAPYWIWNILHEWQSLELFGSAGRISASTGAYHFVNKLTTLLGGSQEQGLLVYLITILFVLGFAYGLFLMCSRSRCFNKQRLYLGSAFIFVLLSAALFIRSEFASYNTVRYLIPIVPALSVIIGSSVSKARTRPWGLILIGLIVLSHTTVVAQISAKEGANAKGIQRVRELRDELNEQSLDAAYASFLLYSFNFYTDEAICITDVKGERYRPLSQYVEQSDQIAVLRNHGKVRDFVHQSQGSCVNSGRGTYATYALTPPRASLTEQRLADISHLTMDGRTLQLNALRDRNVATTWNCEIGAQQQETLLLTIADPAEISALRITSESPRNQPQRLRLEFRPHRNSDWMRVAEESVVTGYFWSGPRPFWEGVHWRMEFRFDPVMAKEIRIIGLCRTTQRNWEIAECQVFRTGPEMVTFADFLPRVVDQIRALKLRALYCDRWVANEIHEIFGGAVLTPLDPKIFPAVAKLSTEVDIRLGSALLVQKDQVPTTEWALHKRGISTQKSEIGPWQLYTFNASNPSEKNNDRPPLYWTGLGCFLNIQK